MTADFEKWRSTFDIQSYQGDISNLLVSCSVVRAKHSQLVPAKVSYETFWMRYFYKTHLLEKVCICGVNTIREIARGIVKEHDGKRLTVF